MAVPLRRKLLCLRCGAVLVRTDLVASHVLALLLGALSLHLGSALLAALGILSGTVTIGICILLSPVVGLPLFLPLLGRLRPGKSRLRDGPTLS